MVLPDRSHVSKAAVVNKASNIALVTRFNEPFINLFRTTGLNVNCKKAKNLKTYCRDVTATSSLVQASQISTRAPVVQFPGILLLTFDAVNLTERGDCSNDLTNNFT